MFFGRKRGTATYTTSDWDDGNVDEPPKDPVVALRRLPEGPTYSLNDFREDGNRKKWILVGRDAGRCDIVLPEPDSERPTVNPRHCALISTPEGRVYVKHSSGKNRTKVNRTRLHDGKAELSPDDVLRLGKVKLVALNRSGLADKDHQPKTTATRPADYFKRAMEVHPNDSKAARALHTPRPTLLRWLAGGRFKKKK